MNNLRKRFEIFCYKHKDWGIPNLMLYIALGSALVLLMSMINGGSALFSLLCFDKTKILQGQVWRLFTYVFTDVSSGFLGLIFLYFFYNLGRHVEMSMGTFRFNLFYFSGVILMDVFAMIFCPTEAVIIDQYLVEPSYFTGLYTQMAFYLHLSLVLVFAATYPDSEFRIFFILPVKAWFLSLIYLVLIAIQIINMSQPLNLFPHSLFPLVGLANFLLFAGKDVLNLLPPAWRPSGRRQYRTVRSKPQKKTGTIPFPNANQAAPKEKPNYNHRCTICGRTDVSSPELEFRYCSKCNGYHCYCEDHISNHTHIE